MAVILESRLTCPHCGYNETLHMPEDYCLYFHDCSHCGQRIQPKHGDCCVFCSYGSVPCPPVQKNECC